MSEAVEQHIEAVVSIYKPLIGGIDSRLVDGKKLWRQFEDAVAAYRNRGMVALRQVAERVNELVVGRIILNDQTLPAGKIHYEPQIGTMARRIDFAVPDVNGEWLYVEVKTVHPGADDSDKNWDKYEKRREMHTVGTQYIVNKGFLGAEIYGNSFSARSKFMEYARAFESRLAVAREIEPGRGVLIFCGNGFDWHVSELEDFADFYRTGQHRPDDPFGKMEAEAIRQGGIELLRNIAAFGFVKRPALCITEETWISDVRGPASPF